MKIFKKIGIGFLALIICFCSCFKFINAEMLNQPVYLEFENTYVLVIDSSSLLNEDFLIASSPFIEVYYSPNEISFVDSSSDETTTATTQLSFIKTENEFSYYSFVYPLTSVSYWYEDDSIAYFEDYDTNFSVYITIYDLVETYIFGGNIIKGSHQDLTTTTLSSIICILVFALPFLVIWKVIKVIMG